MSKYVVFDTFSFSEDMESINISLHITEEAAQSGYQIGKVYLEYYKNRQPDGSPSEHAVVLVPSAISALSYSTTVSVDTIEESVPLVDGLNGTFFYLVVTLTSPVLGIKTEQAALFDWQAVYRVGMKIVSDFNNNCEKGRCTIPSNMEQYVLVYNALILAFAAQDLQMIETLWTRFIDFAPGGITSTCNCA